MKAVSDVVAELAPLLFEQRLHGVAAFLRGSEWLSASLAAVAFVACEIQHLHGELA